MPPLHVLLVEDTPAVAKSLQLCLEQAGHRVTLAENGWQAAEMVRQNPVDVVVTDYDLPGLTGSQLCFLLRSNHERCDLPIIMITGKAMELDVEWLHDEHSLVSVLAKPVKPKELIALIDSCCSRQS